MPIRPEILQALLRQAVDAKEQTKEINDDVARDRKQAVQEHGLHQRAFSLCVTLKRMEQVKRIAFLEALDTYREILKLDEETQIEAFDEHKPRLRAVP